MSVAPSPGGGSQSSKPNVSSMIGPGIGGLSDIFGLFSGLNQQNQENQAITQTGDELQQDLGALTGEGSRLYGDYTQNAAPALDNTISAMPGPLAGYQGQAGGDYGSEAGYGRALGASPYPGMIAGDRQRVV